MPHFQSRRRRVAILTLQGFQKLQAAQSNAAIWNQYTQTCTLETLSEQTGLSTHTLSKVHARKATVDLRTLVRYFSAFNLTLESSDYITPIQHHEMSESDSSASIYRDKATASPSSNTVVSWGMAPDVSVFYDRATELETLQQWILEHHCRLITILGMDGIGKTWLATKLTEQVRHKFQYVVWRSLRPITQAHSPIPVSDFLDDLIRYLSPQSNVTIPESIDAKMRQLIHALRCNPCLLVLDNLDSILPEYDSPADAQVNSSKMDPSNHAAYNALLRYLGQGRHQSCVVLTSRVEPKPIQSLVGNRLGARSLSIQGLQVAGIQQLFRDRGTFEGTAAEWNRLVSYYDGNPQLLGVVATTIQRLFHGSIKDFLQQNALICEDIGVLLGQQLDTLSRTASTVINVLATQDMPISLLELRSHVTSSVPNNILLETLTSLKTRSLINVVETQFSLPPFLMDYVRTQNNQIEKPLVIGRSR